MVIIFPFDKDVEFAVALVENFSFSLNMIQRASIHDIVKGRMAYVFNWVYVFEANQELNNLYQNSNSVFYFLRRMKKEGKNVEEGRCLRGGDGRLGFIEEDRAKIWKEHMEKIMNEENEWDHMVETDVVEGPVEKVARNEIVEAMQRMKSGKATGPSKVSVEMIVASGKIGLK